MYVILISKMFVDEEEIIKQQSKVTLLLRWGREVMKFLHKGPYTEQEWMFNQ